MINIENLSNENIFNAVNYIETNNIRLIESIRYDVIINNKRYPPKELIKHALNLLNDKKVNFIFEYKDIIEKLEYLGFKVIIKNNIWKLGTRWGQGKPSFYEMITRHCRVIGPTDMKYSIGDLILLSDGFTVFSLAKIIEDPIKVTESNFLKEDFLKYKIEYEDWMLSYKVDFISLKKSEVFQYQLQQGIRKVRDNNIIDKAVNIWENRDFELSNIVFYTKYYQKPPKYNWIYPCLILEKRGWNDYGNYNSFDLYFYFDRNNRNLIGPIKIIDINSNDTELEEGFKKLEKGFCSLGQTIDFYKNLRDWFPIHFRNVMSSLNDISVVKSLTNKYGDNKNFKNLTRTSEAELIYKDFNSIFTDSVKLISKEFEYIINLEGAIKEHTVNFKFDLKGNIKNRFFCIVGKNATGKTKYLSSLANKLSDENEDGKFYPSRPNFSKIVTASFSYFDKFRSPESRDTNYSFIGIRDNGNLIDEEKFTDYIWSSYRKIISDIKKKEFYFTCLKSSLEIDNLHFKIEDINTNTKKEFIEKTSDIFSSGQNIIFQFITRFIECVENNSLLIFDEPETHLHPNITGRLIRTINSILEKYNSFCILSTHSPIVLQEMKSENIIIFDRKDNYPLTYKPSVECFGENLTVISNSIFKVDEEKELYKIELDNLSKKMSYEEIINEFENNLSINARLYLKSKFNRHD
jgi:predicted ATPase